MILARPKPLALASVLALWASAGTAQSAMFDICADGQPSATAVVAAFTAEGWTEPATVEDRVSAASRGEAAFEAFIGPGISPPPEPDPEAGLSAVAQWAAGDTSRTVYLYRDTDVLILNALSMGPEVLLLCEMIGAALPEAEQVFAAAAEVWDMEGWTQGMVPGDGREGEPTIAYRIEPDNETDENAMYRDYVVITSRVPSAN